MRWYWWLGGRLNQWLDALVELVHRWWLAIIVATVVFLAAVLFVSVRDAGATEHAVRTPARMCVAPIISGHKCVSPNCSRWYICFDMRHRTPSGGPGVLSSMRQATTETRG